MPQPAYSVFEIRPEWVLEPEALGSKEKFWYRAKDDEPEWLFKFPQQNTGQHWAEKIAAEVAAYLKILHARVEFAVFQGTRGSATESFARDGRSLFHGNQILAGQVLGYDPAKTFRQSDHTLANIFRAIDKIFVSPGSALKAKAIFASYLVLDALIGNTDRHHENWGILLKQVGNDWQGMLAPTFDHASSGVNWWTPPKGYAASGSSEREEWVPTLRRHQEPSFGTNRTNGGWLRWNWRGGQQHYIQSCSNRRWLAWSGWTGKGYRPLLTGCQTIG